MVLIPLYEMARICNFWYKVHSTVFTVNKAVLPTYSNFFKSNWYRGVYFTHVKSKKDVDEIKASINEHMKKDKSITGIIQIDNFVYDKKQKSLDDIIHDNYNLPTWYAPEKKMTGDDKYMLFFNNIDMENWNGDQIRFLYYIAQNSYDYGKFFGVVPVYDKEKYMRLLEINHGCKVMGFDKTGSRTEEQHKIYNKMSELNLACKLPYEYQIERVVTDSDLQGNKF